MCHFVSDRTWPRCGFRFFGTDNRCCQCLTNLRCARQSSTNFPMMHGKGDQPDKSCWFLACRRLINSLNNVVDWLQHFSYGRFVGRKLCAGCPCCWRHDRQLWQIVQPLGRHTTWTMVLSVLLLLGGVLVIATLVPVWSWDAAWLWPVIVLSTLCRFIFRVLNFSDCHF